jgi:uncharacterized coiled-coil protein SlyX
MKTQKGEGMSDKSLEKEVTELRERVVRLEVQVAEMTKRLEAMNTYTRQLYEYLNKLSSQ